MGHQSVCVGPDKRVPPKKTDLTSRSLQEADPTITSHRETYPGKTDPPGENDTFWAFFQPEISLRPVLTVRKDQRRRYPMIPHELCQPNLNFLGLPEELADPTTARVWVLPVPYEATTTYGAGTRNGPMAILSASRQVELYDHRHGCEPAERLGFATLPPMDITVSTPEAMINRLAAAVETVFSQPPSPELLVVLGGEHSISAGVARGLARVVDAGGLVCVQVDAHADLRDEFEGSPFNHACAARRIAEVCPVFQIGIRNISKEEAEFCPTASNIQTFFREQWGPSGVNALRDFVSGKTVYLTIDLDGLDPSIMPAVGTPEPGGLLWHELLEIIRTIAEAAARIPVMDVVELAPIPGMIAPDFLAAKLIYWAAADLLLPRCGPDRRG